jgi:hypothetical protein
MLGLRAFRRRPRGRHAKGPLDDLQLPARPVFVAMPPPEVVAAAPAPVPTPPPSAASHVDPQVAAAPAPLPAVRSDPPLTTGTTVRLGFSDGTWCDLADTSGSKAMRRVAARLISEPSV